MTDITDDTWGRQMHHQGKEISKPPRKNSKEKRVGKVARCKKRGQNGRGLSTSLFTISLNLSGLSSTVDRLKHLKARSNYMLSAGDLRSH